VGEAVLAAGASLNEAPTAELQQLALNILATFFNPHPSKQRLSFSRHEVHLHGLFT